VGHDGVVTDSSLVAPALEPMLDDLRTLVEIESPSRDAEALLASARALSTMMRELLGADPEIVDSPAGPHVHWKGGANAKVLIVGHHDTVFPKGTLAKRPFAVADGKATGPGVFDMKAGIVQALHAVASLPDRSVVEILISSDEEVGSVHSRDFIVERAKHCGAVLVLEPSADGGALKVGRKGTGTFEVRVYGRAAHAGLEPEKGVNSLVEAASQVLRVATFGDPSRGTTVTPTVASAGTADNVVPALTIIYVDVRVEQADERARVDRAMAGLRTEHPEARIEVLGGFNRPPMPTTASETLFPVAVEAAKSIGLDDLRGVAVGGGSDGNFTAAAGVPTLDGLGAVGGGAHADHEWVDVTTMPTRALLLASIVRQFVALCT
jgi:glutamate carboxypeptidase